ncbi:MAG: DNA polymerase domain-containing protein, partial [archaeon]
KERVLGDWKHLITGASLDKIYFNKPEDIRMLREALGQDETAEADVIYTTRFLVEIKVRTGYFILSRPPKSNNNLLSYRDIIPIDVRNIPSRNIHFDIEAVDNRTVLTGLWDSYTNKYHSFGWARKTSYSNSDVVQSLNKDGNKTVRNLPIKRDTNIFSNIKTPLKLFFEYMNTTKPDVLAGWYIGGYDVPQLFQDSKEHGIDVNKFSPLNSAPAPEKIKGLVQIDLLAGYKKIQSQELRSYRLPNVIKAEFGIDVPSDPKRIPKMWENMPELVDYNTSHVDACKYLDEQKGIIDFVYQLAYVCCCRFDDTESAMRLIDALMLSARDEFIVYPNKPPHEDYGKKNEEEVQGATVLEPIPGVVDEHEIIIDASKLYPTTIISNNLGVEKLDPNGDIKVELKGLDLFIWNNFNPKAVEKFKKYANEQFNKKWMLKATLVKNTDKNPKSYTLKTSKNKMVLKIDEEKTAVKLFVNGKRKDIFKLVKSDSKLWVYKPDVVTEVVRFSSTTKCELSKAFGFLFDLRTQYDDELKELMKDEANNRELIELKRQQSFAVKIPTNSIYGLVGNAGFRLYNKKVQECVTQLARDYLQFIIDMSIKYCKNHNIQYKIIYGDTDSVHLKLIGVTLDESVKIGYAIAKYINKFSYKFAARQGVKPENQSYKVKLEAISETALYKAKKRYAQKI